MILINSVDKLLDLVKTVKDLKKGYLTNFFLDVPKAELWIKLEILYYEPIGESVFLLKKNQDFFNLYFLAAGLETLEKDVVAFISKFSCELFVIDIIGRKIENHNICKIFTTRGFYPYTSLVRMSKMIAEQNTELGDSEYIRVADRMKSHSVYNLLHQYFDPYAEQLPLLEEIDNLCKKERILVYSEDNSVIQGFLIFEIVGITSYLRYWFVHPEHRDKKIGSLLLRRFFKEGSDTKRELFWVIESNENAIKRYEHFGFIKEDLFDYIMINKNISYGR